MTRDKSGLTVTRDKSGLTVTRVNEHSDFSTGLWKPRTRVRHSFLWREGKPQTEQRVSEEHAFSDVEWQQGL